MTEVTLLHYLAHMDDFDIEVEYKGQQLSFPAQVHLTGYTHKIEVTINNIPVVYEPDEERNYRAIVASDNIQQVDAGLLKIIGEKIQEIVS